MIPVQKKTGRFIISLIFSHPYTSVHIPPFLLAFVTMLSCSRGFFSASVKFMSVKSMSVKSMSAAKVGCVAASATASTTMDPNNTCEELKKLLTLCRKYVAARSVAKDLRARSESANVKAKEALTKAQDAYQDFADLEFVEGGSGQGTHTLKGIRCFVVSAYGLDGSRIVDGASSLRAFDYE